MKMSFYRWGVPVVVSLVGAAAWLYPPGIVSAKPQIQSELVQIDSQPPEVDEGEENDDDQTNQESEDMDADEEADVAEIEMDDDLVASVESDGLNEQDDASGDNEEERFEEQTMDLVQQIEVAKAEKAFEQVEQLRNQLKEVVASQFAVIEGQRQRQIESLEKRLNALRSLMETRAQNAEKIIERRLKTLLQETDELDWNPTAQIRNDRASDKVAKTRWQADVLERMKQRDEALRLADRDMARERVMYDIARDRTGMELEKRQIAEADLRNVLSKKQMDLLVQMEELKKELDSSNKAMKQMIDERVDSFEANRKEFFEAQKNTEKKGVETGKQQKQLSRNLGALKQHRDEVELKLEKLNQQLKALPVLPVPVVGDDPRNSTRVSE